MKTSVVSRGFDREDEASMRAQATQANRATAAREDAQGLDTRDVPGLDALPRHVHLLGAGGAGLSGIGRILAARGLSVTGHDLAESILLDGLRGAGVPLELGVSHGGLLPPATELVVRSAAVPDDDPQVEAARTKGIPVLKYSQMLPRLAPPARQLGVAGTHGKTSVSWMLWHALEGIADAFGGPVSGALIGGVSRTLGTNALAGSHGGWFCYEACEYDRTFLRLSPRGAIVTNVEADHLDYYGSLDAILRAFACFVEEVPSDGLVVLGREVPQAVELGGRASTIWRLGSELEVDLLGEERGRFRFRLRGPGWATPPVALQVPGRFQVENAGLALALAIGLTSRFAGVPAGEAARAAARGLEGFQGVKRRFEPWAEVNGVDVVHDYAHHPTEVRVTIEAALRAYPGAPLHVLFQPHQHSRTARFLGEFAESLRAADRVVVAEVYGARRHRIGERSAGSAELAAELGALGVDAVVGGPLASAVQRLVAGLPSRATALILGAGDVDLVKDGLLRDLALRGATGG